MGQPTGDFGQEGVRPRTGEVVSGDLLLAIGGPDGSEARPCPDGWRPEPRRIRDRRQDRPELGPSPAVGPLAMGSAAADLPLLDREDDIARLLAALSEGRSVRLVGQAGSGRSTLLAAVADAAAGIAPDGVVRLSGHHRTGADLLQDLFAATHHAPGYRPDRRALASLLSQVGAVVVIDDLDVDDEELAELLDAAPDCAFLVTVPPGSPVLTPGLRLEDHPVAASPSPPAWRWPAAWRAVSSTRPSGPGRSTCGSSPRACRCASSRRPPCSASATSPWTPWSPRRRTATTSSAWSRRSANRTTRPSSRANCAAPSRCRPSRRARRPPSGSPRGSASPRRPCCGSRWRSAASARPHRTCRP
ncbi:hypothetical protein ACFQ1I_28995 [Kitasatospora arboriphila]